MLDPTQKFASAARDFCDWVEGVPGEAAEEARKAQRHLVRLYQAALDLPDRFEEFDARRVSDDEWDAIYRRFGAMPFNYYASTFDPHNLDGEQRSMSDLADDLADIWRDIKVGLAAFDLGHTDAATWEWKEHFWWHWGRHAAGAIYALHVWLMQHRSEF